jgi:hypothetical protein
MLSLSLSDKEHFFQRLAKFMIHVMPSRDTSNFSSHLVMCLGRMYQISNKRPDLLQGLGNAGITISLSLLDQFVVGICNGLV